MSTITQPDILAELDSGVQTTQRLMRSLRWRVRGQLLLEGLGWTAGLLVASAAASLAADWLLRFDLATRVSISMLVAILACGVAYRRLLRPLRLKLSDLDLAITCDRSCPGLGQRVANVMQLPQRLANNGHVSHGMVRAAVLKAAQDLRRARVDDMFCSNRRTGFAGLLAASLLLPAAFCWTAPDVAELWTKRWLLGSNIRWPQKTYMSVVGLTDSGEILVPRDEPVLLEVTAAPTFEPHPQGWMLSGRGQPLVISASDAPTSRIPDQVQIRHRTPGGSWDRASFITRHGQADFRCTLPRTDEPVEVMISGGDDWFGPIRIVPTDRSEIERLVVRVQQPVEDKPLQFEYGHADSQFLFLPKSTVSLDIQSTNDLHDARLVAANPGHAPQLKRVSSRTYSTTWTLNEPLQMELRLVGLRGKIPSRSYPLSLDLRKDQQPRVQLRWSGVGGFVTPRAQVPLSLRANDDFGLTRIHVELEQTRLREEAAEKVSHEFEIPFSGRGDGGGSPHQFEGDTTLQLAEYGLLAGAVVRIRGAADDNCADGPQTGYSRWITLQVASAEELMLEILARQRRLRARFGRATELARETRLALESTSVSDGISGLIRKHQALARNVWQIANGLDATLAEMQLNRLGTPQALDLMKNEIIWPMRNLHSGPLLETRAALAAIAQDSAKDSTHQSRALELQTEVVQVMDQLLDRMSHWESFVDVVHQLEELIKRQEAILKSTQQLQDEQTEGVFDE